MNPDNDPNNVPASLYEEGDKLHKQSKDEGYMMNPASQGVHGKYAGKNKMKCAQAFSLENIKAEYVWMAAGGIAAAGVGYLGYKLYCDKQKPKMKKRHKKKAKKAWL